MGGFHLFEHDSKERRDGMSHEEDTPVHPLAADNLNGNDKTIDIDFSSFTIPTEAEIQDRGKGDCVAKVLVLLQTSWFAMQCVARVIERLPVTPLETATLAYAAMNFAIYTVWWNKPLNINRPIRVFRKSAPEVTNNGNQLDSGESESNEAQSLMPGSGETASRLVEEPNCLLKIFKFIVGSQDGEVDLSHEDKVPSFWASNAKKGAGIAYLIMLGVGIFFGAIHYLDWIFPFPTHIERSIWRVSSLVITFVPIYIPLAMILGALLGGDMGSEKSGSTVFYFAPLSGGILYIMARVFTLILAFISLRDLPPGAYDTVSWTTFIPHV